MDTLDALTEEDGLAEKDPFYGVLATGDKETDYQLCAGEFALPKPRNTFWMNTIEYHQPDISAVSCTAHGSMGALSDLTAHVFTDEERKAIWDEAQLRGAKEGWGWYTASAVDLMRQKAPSIIGEDFMTFNLELGSEEFCDAIDTGYSIVISFRGNTDYNSDKNDGILDKTSHGTTVYGHCVRMVASVERDVYEVIVDNYSKRKGKIPNRYRVRRADIPDLVKNGVFSKLGYIFVYKHDLEKMEQEVVIPAWGVNSWAKAVEKGIVKDGDDFNAVFADGYVEQMLIKLGGLSQTEGGVSLLRMVVALDRLGIL